ncbi:MAG: TonB-dependent receptor [Parvularculaceae bacterium]
MAIIDLAERPAAGADLFNGDVADKWRLNLEYHAGVSATDGQLAPLPAVLSRGFGKNSGDAAVIDLANPTLPQSIRDLVAAQFGPAARAVIFEHRYAELGPRLLRVDRRYGDFAASLERESEDGATLAVSYRLGGNRTVSKNSDRIDLAKLQIALDPAACAATAGCAIVDFFNTPSISKDAIDFIRTAEVRNIVRTREHELSASISTPIRFGENEDGRFSAGVELRRSAYETVNETPPGALPVGLVFNGDQRNSEKALDVFANIDSPLFRALDYFGDADASIAMRVSQSSASGTSMNFEGGFDWRPARGVSLFTRQFVGARAPNTIELYSVGATLENFFVDPCSPQFIAENATIAENCASAGALGVTPGFQQTASLATTTEFGNPKLEPEKIRSRIYGVSITPTEFTTAIPGRLQLTATWLDYEIRDAVSVANDSLFTCYLSQSLSSPHCGANPGTGAPAIVRDPITRQVISYDILRMNDGELNWRGLDLEARYSTKPGYVPFFDSIWVSALHTYTDRVLLNYDGENLRRLDGLIDFPKHRTLVSLGADVGGWSFVAYANRRGRVRTIDTEIPEARVAPALYLDLAARYDVSDRAYIQANVQNIADRKPQIAAFGSFGNFAPEYYDPIGRRYTLAVKFNF